MFTFKIVFVINFINLNNDDSFHDACSWVNLFYTLNFELNWFLNFFIFYNRPITEGTMFGKKIQSVNLFVIFEGPVNIVLIIYTFGNKFTFTI